MSASRPMLDVDALLDSVGGDCDLLDELATTFTAQVPSWIASLRAALVSADAEAVFRVAHGVSGAVAYFRAPHVRQRAADLEAIGRAGHLDGAAPVLDRLEAELLDLSRVLGETPWHR